MSNLSRFMVLAAGLVLSLMLSGTALAHTDPPGSSSTGTTISLTAFRNNGVTPVLTSGNGSVSECETIQYRATLSYAGGTNAAFERGLWTITTPDGAVHIIRDDDGVTLAPALPCIGGPLSVDDPNSAANDGRGLCDGAPSSVISVLVPYTVSPGDVNAFGFIGARTALSGAFAHLNTGDTAGVGAFSPLNLPVEFCDDGAFCNGEEVCDPAATDGIVLGQCVAGTPPDCDDGDVCTTDSCDETADACVNAPGALDCDDNNVCTTDTCDPIDGCVNTPGALDCDDNDVCTTDTCDPEDGCVNTPGALDCDDNNVCTTDRCDPEDGCVNTPGALDCDDNNVCTTDTCDPEEGCVNTAGALDCDDNNVCTTDTCDPEDGCVNTPGALDCDDGDVCTDDFCDPELGCQNVPADPLPSECIDEGICLVVIDEEGLDNDFRSIEMAADVIGLLTPGELINDESNVFNDDVPTEVGNPPFPWNILVDNGVVDPGIPPVGGDLVLLPTGQVDDEGWYNLPPGPEILYKDNSRPPNCGLPGGYDEWIDRFIAGTLSQHCLDEVLDVMPLRNQDLAQLVGRECVAVVYDSDISINTEPLFGNLQGERYGLFHFFVEALEVPGSIPESKSSTSLYDLWLRVLGVFEGDAEPLDFVDIHDHEPDAAELKDARWRTGTGTLSVRGESDFGCSSFMTVTVDGPDEGSDPLIDQFLLEEPILQCNNGRFSFEIDTGGVDVRGRRLSIQTDHGGAYNGTIR